MLSRPATRLAVTVLMTALLATGPAALAATPGPAPTPSGSAITGEGKPPAGSKAQTLTFGIKPQDAKGVPPRGSFRFRLDPGLTGTDVVSVYNYATAPLDLRLYPTDATTNRQGSFSVPPRSTPSHDVGSWIRLALPQSKVFRVAARTRVDVAFRLVVPAAASPGDHLGGIVLSLQGNSTDSKGNRIKVDSRVSAPVTVRVAGAVRSQLSVEHFTASYKGVLAPLGRGKVRISYTVRNTGNVLLGAQQRMTVEGWFGQRFGPRLADLQPLAPGSSTDVSLVVPDTAPVFRYRATALLTPTSAAGDRFADRAQAGTTLWAVPSPLLVTLLLLAALAWGVRRALAHRPAGRHAGNHTHPRRGRDGRAEEVLA